MSDAARKPMTADAFILWNLDQPERWELVDGVAVLKFDNGPEMMAGGSRNHASIATNLIAALHQRLRGGPCRPVGGDLASRMVRGNIRRPDVTVECGKGRGTDLETVEPRVFVEVLSPSTRGFDLVKKADEYRRVPSLQHYLLLEPDRPEALLWSRDADGDWSPEEITGLDRDLALTGIGVSLSMAEVYEDVELAEGG